MRTGTNHGRLKGRCSPSQPPVLPLMKGGRKAEQLRIARPDERKMGRRPRGIGRNTKGESLVDDVRRLLYLTYSWSRKPSHRLSRWAIRPVRV